MSGQKKKNFQIEAFKHRVMVDPKYAEKTWKILEHAIEEIYNHNASGLSFEELYRFSQFVPSSLILGCFYMYNFTVFFTIILFYFTFSLLGFLGFDRFSVFGIREMIMLIFRVELYLIIVQSKRKECSKI